MSEILVQPQANPVDLAILDQLNRLHVAGYGWLLDLVRKDGSIAIKVDPIMPPVDEYERPTDWRAHAFLDHMSMVAYAKKYGAKDKSVIFYDDTSINLVLDESKEKGHREVLSMPFEYSDAWQKWAAILGQKIPHKQLRDGLTLVRHTMVDPSLLLALRSIKYAEEVKHDSEIRDDDATYGVVFTVKGAGDSLKGIPRSFHIIVPILDMDVIATERHVNIEVKVELAMPSEPGDPLRILMIAPAFDQARRQRIHSLVNEVRSALGDDWLVCNGTFREVQRKIGDPGRFKIGGPAPLRGA